MQKRKFRKSTIFKICLVIAVVIANIVSFSQKIDANKQYNLSESEILSTYREKHHTMVYITMLAEREFEANVKLFCGNSCICHISVPEKAVLDISCNNGLGEGKLLFEKKTDNTIQTVVLEHDKTDVTMEAGEYDVFLVGKWFSRKFDLQSENIIFEIKT